MSTLFAAAKVQQIFEMYKILRNFFRKKSPFLLHMSFFFRTFAAEKCKELENMQRFV
jgi:hypothetical protein